ncbi:MAG: NAD(P)-dependent oxidoreductase [Polyangiaceae bacterium]
MTGAAGQLGRAISRHFRERGHEVRATDVTDPETASARAIVRCDVTDVDGLAALARGCDAVVHLAALGTPWASSEEEIFRVNASGTFCVYRAAALAGVPRVVCASSINALGLYFGPRPVAVERIPVDEGHPCSPADPYSFSKLVLESVAAYFFHREGIASVCFRMGQNMGEDLRPVHESVRDAVSALLALPRAEGQSRAQRVIRSFFDANRDPRRRYEIPFPDHAIATGAVHLWSCLDDRDRNHAFELAVAKELHGAHVVNLCDDHNQLGLPSRELSELFYPNAVVEPHLCGTQSLLSVERAKSLLDFVPAHSVKRFFA